MSGERVSSATSSSPTTAFTYCACSPSSCGWVNESTSEPSRKTMSPGWSRMNAPICWHSSSKRFARYRCLRKYVAAVFIEVGRQHQVKLRGHAEPFLPVGVDHRAGLDEPDGHGDVPRRVDLAAVDCRDVPSFQHFQRPVRGLLPRSGISGRTGSRAGLLPAPCCRNICRAAR